MSDRVTTNSSTTPKPTGLQYLDEYSGHIGRLYGASVLPLTGISGADAITATVDPVLPAGGLSAGMKFTAKWAFANTGAATLNIGGVGAVSIVDRDGGTLTAGQLSPGVMDILEYDGTDFVLITGGTDTGAVVAGMTTYDVTTVWNNIYPVGTIIMVELWGAGGGGNSVRGGGGGAYQRRFFVTGNLTSTVTITVPSGGAYPGGGTGNDGGACTFGSYLSAAGGKGALAADVRAAGGGGGPAGDIVSGVFGGGSGGSATLGDKYGKPGWYGGGGGAASGDVGGGSQFGGNGGDAGVAGMRPGGGGGNTKAGGAGRCIITVF